MFTLIIPTKKIVITCPSQSSPSSSHVHSNKKIHFIIFFLLFMTVLNGYCNKDLKICFPFKYPRSQAVTNLSHNVLGCYKI